MTETYDTGVTSTDVDLQDIAAGLAVRWWLGRGKPDAGEDSDVAVFGAGCIVSRQEFHRAHCSLSHAIGEPSAAHDVARS